MKRLLSILLILCMLLSTFALISCEQEDDDDEDENVDVVEDAMQATSDLDAVEMTMELKVVMSIMGASFTIPVEMTVASKGDEMSLDMSANVMGESTEMKMYSDGEWMYYLEDGEGYKTPYDENASDEAGLPTSFDDLMKDVPADVFNDATVTKNEDGDTVMTITITEEKYPEVYEGIKQGLASEGISAEDTEISDIDAEIIIAKEGYLKSAGMEFTMEMSMEGQTMTAEAELVMEVTATGNDVTITPIPNCEDFPVQQ